LLVTTNGIGTMTDFHIGRFIQQKLRVDGRSVTWLAQKLNCSRTNIYLIFKKKHLDSEILMRLSLAMKFDFFMFLSEEYNINIRQSMQETHR
jgi:hypothetical protein